MKRSQRETSSKADRKTRAIDPERLTTVRGGRGLGIRVQLPPLSTPGMENQHNETLLRL
jgi:hypothetical protein